MTVLAMKETYLHAWIILKKMTIPAWLDREENTFEPHFLKNTRWNYAKVVRFEDAGHFVSEEKHRRTHRRNKGSDPGLVS